MSFAEGKQLAFKAVERALAMEVATKSAAEIQGKKETYRKCTNLMLQKPVREARLKNEIGSDRKPPTKIYASEAGRASTRARLA